MAKKGMKRPEVSPNRNEFPLVPLTDNDLAADNLREEWELSGMDPEDFWRKW